MPARTRWPGSRRSAGRRRCGPSPTCAGGCSWRCSALAALALVATAVRLSAPRDLGAGILPPKPGPARGGPAPPLALAWRLQRGALAGWVVGFAILGAAFGSIAQDIGDVIGDSADVRDALTRLGGAESLVDAYIAATFGVMALIAAAFAVGSVLRLRGEESDGRAEPLLATAVSRTRWALGHTLVAFGGTAVLMLVAGLFAGAAHAAQTGDAGQRPRLLGAALAQVPAAWVLAGFALAIFGLLPRATLAAWAALALCLALAELGPVVELSQSVIDLSPFAHSPQLPGGGFTAAPPGWPRSPRRSPPRASPRCGGATSAHDGPRAARKDDRTAVLLRSRFVAFP